MATPIAGIPLSDSIPYLLQSDRGPIVSGSAVSLGDGAETPLILFDDGFGTRLTSGVVRRALYSVLAADTSTTSNVTAPVAGFQIPVAVAGVSSGIEANGLYLLEMVLLGTTSVSGVALQLEVTGPTAQTTWTAYDMSAPTAQTLGTGTQYNYQNFSVWSSPFAVTTPLGVGVVQQFRVSGMFKLSGAPAVGIGVSMRSETNTNQTTLKAGSFIKVTRLG